MDGITNGAIAAFDDSKGFMGQLDATPQTHDQAMAEMQDDVHGGVVGKVGSVLGAVTGMPGLAALGQVGQSVVDGVQARDRVGHYNDMTGANLDASLSGNIGEQGARSLAGMVGGRAGSTIGAMTGTPIGVIGGGLLGSSMAQNAVSAPGSSTPGTGTGTDGYGGATMGGSAPAVASATPSPQAVASSPVDFTGYASYAEGFFT
ncbi:MAG: hypothetical protein CME72_12320 [Halomonadaceae bacterium]|nr:hypothetical protein [Halomonadaceae bacterium]